VINLPVLTAEFAPPTKKCRPWRVDRYKLLSWWDMERFSARSFFLIGNLLGILPENVRKAAHPEHYQVDGNEKVSDKTKNHVAVWVIEVQKRCEEIALESAVTHAKRFLWRLERNQTYSDVSHQIDELKNRIFDDMKLELFLHVPHEHAKLYQLDHGFGPEVDAAFPSTAYDIQEAHTCLALERPTASVFHLMRVLEVALVSLGKLFGLHLDHTNWAPAIDQIQSEIRNMGKDAAWKQFADWKDKQEFYSQAVDYLQITKDAWRNHTAHTRGKFTQEEARIRLMNVKLFMQKIAQQVSE
jgi:hypothetical protein